MKSKLFSVRVPANELDAIEGVFCQFPGVSPSRLIRAVLLDVRRLGVANALAKHSLRHKKGHDK